MVIASINPLYNVLNQIVGVNMTFADTATHNGVPAPVYLVTVPADEVMPLRQAPAILNPPIGAAAGQPLQVIHVIRCEFDAGWL